ncbi:hypothetical protein [Lolliginicoccus levis]|uniref:hypothetical protein n=1 Tax=Lolliginicoccus levis TaxID=2919542 RepID=UPI00241D759C|nr:hypothetical protein [Lolliginicoccus levis]
MRRTDPSATHHPSRLLADAPWVGEQPGTGTSIALDGLVAASWLWDAARAAREATTSGPTGPRENQEQQR